MPGSNLCAICNRPLPEGVEAARYKPFCSKRCADVDLGRWLKGSYAIPAAAEPDDESESEAGIAQPDEPGESWPGGPGGRKPVRH